MTISKDRSDVVGGILCVQDLLNNCWMTLDFFAPLARRDWRRSPGPEVLGSKANPL
jgi:hypothetical protein